MQIVREGSGTGRVVQDVPGLEEITLEDGLKICRGILDRYERGIVLNEAARIVEEGRRKAEKE